MSYININPANAPVIAQISGSTFISTSGSVGVVAIAGSIGGTTLVDVNSSTAADNISTSDDTLATRTFTLGYNQANDQFTRIYSVAFRSGVQGRAQVPVSGFGFLGMNQVIGTEGTIAEVWDSSDDNMFDTDNVLQVGARTYGFLDQGTSGIWPRIRVLPVSSGQNQFSGLRMPFSGYFLGVASQVIDMAGTIVNVTPASDDDIEGVNLGMLDTMAKNYAYHDASSGWARLRAIAVSSGMDSSPGVRMPFSGYFIGTTSLVIGRNGNIAIVDDPDADDEGSTDSALHVKSFTYGYHDVNGDFTRVRTFALSSGQTQSFSTSLPISGYVLGTASIITDVGGRIANMGDTDDDTKSAAENALDVNSITRGYYQPSNVHVRIRAVKLLSGDSDLEMPFSGYGLLTASALIDPNNNTIAQVIDSINTDALGTGTDSLSTLANLMGFNRTEGVWSRVGVTASGQGTSGMQHRMGVAFSGDIVQIGEGGTTVDVQSSTTSDAVSTSDNPLVTQALNYGINPAAGSWARQTVVGIASGLGFGLKVKEYEAPTYVITLEGLTIQSGAGKMLNIWHVSGDPVVKIKSIKITNLATTSLSGEAVIMDVTRIKWRPSGTTFGAVTVDPRNNESGVALVIAHSVTNFSGPGAAQWNQFILSNRGWESPMAVTVSGTGTLGIVPALQQVNNWVPNAETKGTQDITLLSGYGVAIGQSNDFNPVVGSGLVSLRVVYTVEAPWE